MYINKETNEVIELEAWQWHVVYKDGTEMFQFDKNTMEFHKIGEINMDEVDIFEVFKTSNPNLRYSIKKTDEIKKFVYIYRRTILEANTDNEQKLTFYCFGIFFGNHTLSLYNYILPDDRLVITTDRNIKLL